MWKWRKKEKQVKDYLINPKEEKKIQKYANLFFETTYLLIKNSVFLC